MNAEQLPLKTIFLNALELASPDERQAYLAVECGDNVALRAEVEALLLHHEQLHGFLEPAPPERGELIDGPTLTERPGTVIGHYKLLEQIGEGGFGVVFMAEQERPVRRRVALKVIKPGMDTRQVIARFEAERQALALMDHPNIAKVLDAGTTESGRPYFVMELVKGVAITSYCDAQRLSVPERLRLFLPICQAIQHAHQKGIIHRDIKPSNLMVALYDGRPVPQVIDFGVAKATAQTLTERTMFTQYGQIIGTPEYMSPEQAELNQLDIDTRSDVYSLGVLLYELLTGSTPFDSRRLHSARFDDMLRMIREEEPCKPSTRISTSDALPAIAANRQTEPARLSKLVSGELDWIVMKALAKDRSRRYETASALAADVERHLAGEPVEACPPSATYRLRKIVRRYQGPLLTAAVVALALVTGIILTARQALRATDAEGLAQTRFEAERDARQQADKAQEEAVGNLYHSLTREARAIRLARVSGYRAQAWKLLKQAALLDTSERNIEELRQEAVACLGDFVGLEPHVHADFPADVRTVALHPDGTRVAVGLEDGAVVIREVSTGAEIAQLPRHRSAVYGIAIGTGGKLVASADREGQIRVDAQDGAGAWVANKEFLIDAPNYDTSGTMSPLSIALTPDNKRLIANSWGHSTIRMWDIESGDDAGSFRGPAEEQVRRMVLSPDGKFLAAESERDRSHAIVVWDVASREVKHVLMSQSESIFALAFSPDSKLLACGSAHGLAFFSTSDFKQQLFVPGALGQAIAFSPDSQVLAITGLHHNTIRLWSLVEYRDLAILEHAGRLNSLAFSRDGKVLVGSDKQSVRVWNLAGANEKLARVQHAGGLPGVAFSPDGKRLATAGKDHTVLIWDAASGTVQKKLEGFSGPLQTVAFSPDGRLLATGDWSGVVELWDAGTWKKRATLDHQLGRDIWSVAFSPDDSAFAASGDDGLMLWQLDKNALDEQSGMRIIPWQSNEPGKPRIVFCTSFNADGSLLALVESEKGNNHNATVHIWDVKRSRLIDFPAVHVYCNLLSIAFAADGKSLALVSPSGEIAVWDVAGRRRHAFGGGDLTGGGLAAGQGIIALGRDGAWLAAQSGKTITLWDMHTRKQFLALPQLSSEVWCLAWSPDRQRLAIGLSDGGLVLWDLKRVRSLLDGIGLGW